MKGYNPGTKAIYAVLLFVSTVGFSSCLVATEQLTAVSNQSAMITSDAPIASTLSSATTSPTEGVVANSSLAIQSASNIGLAARAEDQNTLGKLFDKAKYENFNQQKSLLVFSIPGQGNADDYSNDNEKQ